jgi:hypothetical protein
VRQQNAIFRAVGAKALRRADDVLQRLLPDGVFEGCEYVARNPKRADRHLGSFRINLDTGAWADFALDDPKARGGDLISLAAYLHNLTQFEAARNLAHMLGMSL